MTLLVDNIGFERNNCLLFSQIQFELLPSNIIQVRGANGSGKSTLLRVLAGFIAPLFGTISWKNNSIVEHREQYHAAVHYLGHQNGIKDYLTVLENLQLNAALLSIKVNASILNTILLQVGLDRFKNTEARLLSAGQSRRLSIARLLLCSRLLWILDEPTTAMDDKGQQLIAELIDHHLEQGGMAIVATHQDLALRHPINTLSLGEKVHA